MSTSSTSGWVAPVELNRPLRRDAEENRRRVLQAATELFATRGLDASVEEIAISAGVGMGTLYRRFPNKEALIAQLVNDFLDEILAAGLRAVDITDGTGLESFLRSVASLYRVNRGCISRMWTGPIRQNFFEEFDGILAQLVSKGQAAGSIRKDCVPTDVLVAFWAIRGIVESTGDTAPDAWQRHVDIILAGLHPKAAPLSHAALTQRQRSEIARSRQHFG